VACAGPPRRVGLVCLILVSSRVEVTGSQGTGPDGTLALMACSGMDRK